jgi:nitrate reductase NapD
MDEVHIASFVVHHRAEAVVALHEALAAHAGAEIAAQEQTRAILLHECAGTRELLDCMDAVRAVPGVIGVNLVYHHAEPCSALDEPVDPKD